MHAVIQWVRCWLRYETRQSGICGRPPVGSAISRPGFPVHRRKHEAVVSREERVSGSEGEMLRHCHAGNTVLH